MHLQATIQKASGKNKKEKKKRRDNHDVSFADGIKPGEGSDTEAAAAKGDITAPKKASIMTAEELADEEWGAMGQKSGKKKGKKSKRKTGGDDQDEVKDEVDDPISVENTEAQSGPGQVTADEPAGETGVEISHKSKKPASATEALELKGELTATTLPPPCILTIVVDENAEEVEPEESGTRILSKKEKEKLKKEKEKVTSSMNCFDLCSCNLNPGEEKSAGCCQESSNGRRGTGRHVLARTFTLSGCRC